MRKYISTCLFLCLFSQTIYSDSFTYNTYNNHGSVGLVNMPSARFYDESVYGVSIYDGTPDQKLTFTSNPYNWLEASVFYTNIQDKPYPGYEYQDYKDKGFNVKLRLKEEGKLPAIAIGINDIAGTGLYGSEYIVGSYGIANFDFHFGLGWGAYNGSKHGFDNPLGYIDKRFKTRDKRDPGYEGTGSFTPGRYFSDENVSPFFGISYVLKDRLLFKFEHDTTNTNENGIDYEIPENQYSFAIDLLTKKNFNLGIAYERGSTFSIRFSYKNDPKISRKRYEYKSTDSKKELDKYSKLRKNLENNGIGVNKILESPSSIGLELTQFVHPNFEIIEEIILSASADAGIDKEVKTELRIADLKVISEIDDNFNSDSRLIYERKKTSNLNTSTNFVFRPFLASREEFFKGALLLENNSEYVIRDNFFFSSNIKYSLADNFDDLRFPPLDVYPAQVRSDIKQYLKNYNDGIKVGRAQFDYHITPKKNNHFMISAGIFEEMFSGIGLEYLYFQPDKNYAFGFEIFDVVKRDYDMRFGTIDYRNITGSLNFYYRNYGLLPFDLEASYGEYLAGDEGFTFEISRSFENGVEFGVFASFTDVTSEQYGEGSFDKGVFFKIPIFGDLINYSWRPLTKDPGAKLVRKNKLHDLLVRFKPIY